MRTCWETLRKSLIRSVSTLMMHQQFNDAKRTRCELRRFLDAAALLDFLHNSKDGDRDTKDRILATLIELVQSGGSGQALGTALLWLALWPGLDAVYRRSLHHFAAAPEELVSEMGYCFMAIIHRADLARIHRIAATLVRNVERDVREGRQRGWAEEARHADRAEEVHSNEAGDVASTEEPATRGISELGLPPGLSVDKELAAIRHFLVELLGGDADLVVDAAVHGASQREISERLGLTHEATRKRYQRALRRVGRFLKPGMSQSAPPDRVFQSARV